MSDYDKQTDLGYHAYQAYGDHVEWTAHTGKPMPQWDELPPQIKNAWRLAANRVQALTLADADAAAAERERIIALARNRAARCRDFALTAARSADDSEAHLRAGRIIDEFVHGPARRRP